MSEHQNKKTDAELGRQVQTYLYEKGLLTPTNENYAKMQNSQKFEIIKNNFDEILNTLGFDLNDDSLSDTPARVAKMYINDLFWGLDWDNFPKCTTVENKMCAPNEFVLVKDIDIYSVCEHHLQTVDLKVDVAYIPNEKVMGLSKAARICRFLAATGSVQERLNHQATETLKYILNTDNVVVRMEGIHYCMRCRGVEDGSSSTVTMAASGKFAEQDSALRREFLSNIM